MNLFTNRNRFTDMKKQTCGYQRRQWEGDKFRVRV